MKARVDVTAVPLKAGRPILRVGGRGTGLTEIKGPEVGLRLGLAGPFVAQRREVAARFPSSSDQTGPATAPPRPFGRVGIRTARKAAGRRRAPDAGAGAVGGPLVKAPARVAVRAKGALVPLRTQGGGEAPAEAGLVAIPLRARLAAVDVAGAPEGRAAVLVAQVAFRKGPEAKRLRAAAARAVAPVAPPHRYPFRRTFSKDRVFPAERERQWRHRDPQRKEHPRDCKCSYELARKLS